MTPVSIRFPTALYERCGWAATADGLDRAEWIRSVCARASRDSKPPEVRENGLLSLPPETWNEWRAWAAKYGTSIDNFVARVVDAFMKKILDHDAHCQQEPTND